ncbi:MAG: YceI family protein [Vitreimonas sp.]
MRRILAAVVLILALAAPAQAQVQAYRLDRAHAALRFEMRQFGVPSGGAFADFDAALQFDPARPQDARLDVAIRAASLDAGVATGMMLRAFEAARHPVIRFVSTHVEPRGEGAFRIEGLLTLRGVTRPVVLDATVNTATPLTFTASGAFRRSAFGIGGWPWASDRVELSIEAPFSPA